MNSVFVVPDARTMTAIIKWKATERFVPVTESTFNESAIVKS